MKLVKRYWCDHCNKAGLSARSMTTHEQHCTLNPARSCRVCNLLNGMHHGHDMGELLGVLPDPTAYNSQSILSCNCRAWDGREHRADCTSEHVKLDRALKEAMPKLREAVDDCPTCILAALRQKKIPVPMVEDFNFTAEMKSVFAHANDRCETDYY